MKRGYSMSNYTDELVAKLHNMANENEGVVTYGMASEFAEAHGLKLRSVIAKVISEKIEYERKPERVTKTGAPVVRKAEIVATIEAALGVAVPTLSKASKTDLIRLAEVLNG